VVIPVFMSNMGSMEMKPSEKELTTFENVGASIGALACLLATGIFYVNDCSKRSDCHHWKTKNSD